MLASLLPGLREIRAPLAAGYLWLTIAWLLLHDEIQTGESAVSAVTAFNDLRNVVGFAAVGAAATFVAYVGGTLWVWLAVKVAGVLWATWSWLKSQHAYWRERRHPFNVRQALRAIRRRLDQQRGYRRQRPLKAKYADLFTFTWNAIKAERAEREQERRAPKRDLPKVPPPVEKLLLDRTSETRVDLGLDRNRPRRIDRVSSVGWRRLWSVGQRLAAEVGDLVSSHHGSFTKASEFVLVLEPILCEYIATEHEVRPEDGTSVRSLGWTLNQKWQRAFLAFVELESSTSYDRWWAQEASEVGAILSPEDAYVRLHPRLEPAPFALVKEAKKSEVLVFGEPEVTARLFEELSLVVRRLVGEQQESFLEADRMNGEVEFRQAIAIPIAIAVSVVAFGFGLSAAAWAALTGAGIVAGLALLADSWRRDEARNDFLVELLDIGKAKSPTFERLVDRARTSAAAGTPLDTATERDGLATETAERGADTPGA